MPVSTNLNRHESSTLPTLAFWCAYCRLTKLSDWRIMRWEDLTLTPFATGSAP